MTSSQFQCLDDDGRRSTHRIILLGILKSHRRQYIPGIEAVYIIIWVIICNPSSLQELQKNPLSHPRTCRIIPLRT